MSVVTIRASSLAELFDCPHRWEAKHILGMRSPSSGAARLGTAIHAGTAAFDQARVSGCEITADDAAGEVVKAIRSTDEPVQWDDDLPVAAAERIALALHARYCAEIAPLFDFVAVEAQCERLELTDLRLALTGTTDRIYLGTDGYGILDIKSGARAVGADGKAVTKGHAPQIGVYELLAETSINRPMTGEAFIAGLNTGKTPAAQRAGVGHITGARDLLLGAPGEPGLLEMASALIHGGSFYANPKSQLCGEKYCPRYATCKFKG